MDKMVLVRKIYSKSEFLYQFTCKIFRSHSKIKEIANFSKTHVYVNYFERN